MRKTILIFVMLIVIPFTLAQNLTYSESLTLDNKISSSYQVIPQKTNYTLDYIQINLSFFPKETATQNILELKTVPEAQKSKDAIIFKIENPEITGQYSVNARIQNQKNFPKITNKVPFPVQQLPSDVEKYTEPSDFVDSDNPDIIKLASNLASGEDDQFVVVSKLAGWTKQNIEYNLSTLTADVSQKASWVLENKEGVCDEMTNLFIALNRALGIPARFASGISYTELIKNKWGPHGWAEVYFPGYGWVPFDVAYGEYGFTDPTHIIYKITADTKDITTSYGWYGSDVKVDFKDLDFAVSTVSQGNFLPGYSMDVKAFYDKIGLGSYNLIIARVSNQNSYYIAPNLGLGEVKQIVNMDSREKTAVLPPKSSKNVFWIVKVPALDENYEYSFPIVVSGADGVAAKSEFTASVDSRQVGLDEIEKISSTMGETEEKTYAKNFTISCSPEKTEYFAGETAKITCEFANLGNTPLDDLGACMENDCKYFSLGISQRKSYNFQAKTEGIGTQVLPLFAKNNEISSAAFAEINVSDYPKLEIGSISAPQEISYEDNATVSFLIEKKSVSIPKNLVISVKSGAMSRDYELSLLDADKQFEFPVLGEELAEGANQFEVNITYRDSIGNEYLESKSFAITLKKLSIGQRISSFFRKLLRMIR